MFNFSNFDFFLNNKYIPTYLPHHSTLPRRGDTLVLCIDTDTRYFRDLSLIKLAEIMFVHQVLDEGRTFTRTCRLKPTKRDSIG